MFLWVLLAPAASAHAIAMREALAREYAKCKNRPRRFRDCDGMRMHDRQSVYKLAAEEAGMSDDSERPVERKPLTPAAQRALAEAEERRKQAAANARPREKEFQGPKGPEPTRYGDWENKGIASDF
jgi:hypothetical protein